MTFRTSSTPTLKPFLFQAATLLLQQKSAVQTHRPMQPVLNSIRFGMTFRQNRIVPTAGTEKNPISANNCMICSVKNLLKEFGYSKAQVEALFHEHLLEEYWVRQKRNEAKHGNSAHTYEQLTSPEELGQHNLNPTFLITVLSQGLKMQISSYQLHQGNGRQAVNDAIRRQKPILVFASVADGHTLAGPNVRLSEGHAYLLWPRGNNQWAIQDSYNGERLTNTVSLLTNLKRMQARDSVYHVIGSPPNSDIIRGILDSSPPALASIPVASNPSRVSAPTKRSVAEAPPLVALKPQSVFSKLKNAFRAGWQRFIQIFRRICYRMKS